MTCVWGVWENGMADANLYNQWRPGYANHQEHDVTTEFDLPYPPSANHTWRVVRGQNRVVLSKAARNFRARVYARLLAAGAKPVSGPVALVIYVHAPDARKRDIDNLLKALLDALQHAGLFADDYQVARLTIERGEIVAGGLVRVGIRTMYQEIKDVV